MVTVFAVAADPTGRWLATGGTDGEVRLWDRETRQPRRVLPAGAAVYDLCFSPDGSLLVLAAANADGDPAHEGRVRVWDLKAEKELAPFDGHTNRPARVRFDPTGTRLITTSFA